MMKKIIVLLSVLLATPFVGAVPSSDANNQASVEPSNPSPFHLSDVQALEIGRKIWQNQSGGTVEGILDWEGPAQGGYAQVGINQSLWFSESYLEDPTTTKFVGEWPIMARYLKKHGFDIPEWALDACPWETKQQFLDSLDRKKVIRLRELLATDEAVIAQTHCIGMRLKHAFRSMLESLPKQEARVVDENFARVASEPNGMYALIDYMNFKGEGTNSNERFNGEGWGLLQVLEAMPGNTGNPLQEFVDAADNVLKRLIANHPSAAKCLPGWEARLQTYLPDGFVPMLEDGTVTFWPVNNPLSDQ